MEESDVELLETFKAEAEEHLADVEPSLLEMEEAAAERREVLINSIFRAVHSVKGASGFFGLDTIMSLSHSMESLLMQVRDNEIEFVTDMQEPLIDALDMLRDMIEAIPEVLSPDIEVLTERLASWSNGATEVSAGANPSLDAAIVPTTAMDVAPLRVSPDAVRRAACFGQKVFHIEFGSAETFRAERIPTLREQLTSLGEILEERLSDANVEWLVQSVLSPRDLADALDLNQEFVAEAEVGDAPVAPNTEEADTEIEHAASKTPEASQSEPSEPETPPTAPKTTRHTSETIRVNVRLLDKLMNLAGELVLSRNQLLRSLSHSSSPTTKAILQDLDLITSAIQGDIMNTRMQPIGEVFKKFTRVVRDLSRNLEKRVRLELEGVDVELDKSILELLSDPLTHLIRNSLDHGIELPADRVATGKDPEGTISIRAYHEGGQVHIEIEDDGAGVDPDRIRSTALKRGLMSREQLAGLSDRDARMLIFAPGFSTADQVSDVSGRGVGMDVVKTNISKLSGKIDLESTTGLGSVIRIRLPLTLAIIPSIIVRVGDQRYAVPQVNLVELVRVRDNDAHNRIELVQGAPVLRLRGKLLPLIDLDRVLNKESGDTPPEYWGDTIHVALLQVGEAHFGLVVDDVSDSEEIVVKPLSHMLEGCGIYAGVAIMGDGYPAMILDAAGLAATAKVQLRSSTSMDEAERGTPSKADRRQLVVFTNAPHERFAVELSDLVRLEKIDRDQIQTVGGNRYIKYRDSGLSLTRLEDVLPVRPLEQLDDHLFVLIPKASGEPKGILAGRIIDTVRTDVNVAPVEGMPASVEGQALINGHLTLLLRTESIIAGNEAA